MKSYLIECAEINYFTIEVDAQNEDEAREQIELLCDRLLSNPVIENWSMEINSTDSSSDN